MNGPMSITTGTIKTGFKTGITTTWVLGKVIFPITVIMTILSYTPVIPWVVSLCTPIMKWIGLPGEAAIPLVLGNTLNLYAAIGAILSLSLTVKHVFILAIMLSFSHSLPVECAIARKVGVSPWIMAGVRIGLALTSAIAIHLAWQGGEEQAKYGILQSSHVQAEGIMAIIWTGIKTASMGILQMAMIVIPLMIGIQILKDLKILNLLSSWMTPVTSAIGVARNSSIVLLAGLLFGISFGAGVILQAVKEEPLPKRDLYLLVLFLVACHAVVEDTLIFIPLGIPVWPLLMIRILVAFSVTFITARVWERIIRSRTARSGVYEA
jgi:hypothetical protein